MPKPPDRALLSRLADAYDRIAEQSLGMGDPEYHEIEDQLFDATVNTPYRAVIKNGDIYLADPNGLPGETILVDPASQDDLDDPTCLKPRRSLKGQFAGWHLLDAQNGPSASFP